MSRPWNEGTPCPHLEPDVLGQFNTHEDWVSHASRALTGFTDSNGYELKAICVDNLGRRCANGGDFKRARDEGAFPVRYFTDMKASRTPDVVEALNLYQKAFDDLFASCLSNGVFNAWGGAVDCTNLNEAHRLAGEALGT